MDQAVIQAAKCGDRKAEKTLALWLYELYRSKLSKTHERGEDLVQESIADVFAKLRSHAPDDPAQFRRWALTCARFELLTDIRDRRRDREGAAKIHRHAKVARPPRTVSSSIARRQRQGVMLECLRDLPAIYQEAIMHRMKGGSHSELAEHAEISLDAARKRYSIGQRLLAAGIRRKRATPTPDRRGS